MRRVEADAALALVELVEVAGAVDAGHLVDERSEPAGHVDAAARLDLDDVGAEVGELHRAERPGPHPRHVDDAQAGERGDGRRGSPGAAGRGGQSTRRRPLTDRRDVRRAGGSTPAMRIGDAGATTDWPVADHELAERVAQRAAAPTPATSAGAWTRHAGTPTSWAVGEELVDREVGDGLGDERLDDVVLLGRAGRWSRTPRGGPSRGRRAS